MKIILVTGPSRSGKSEWAEILAQKTEKKVIYVATAVVDPSDREWVLRIQKHQERRPPNWQTLTVSTKLAQTIKSGSASDCFLIDSLGTWVSNLLEEETDSWETITKDLLTSLTQTQADIILVGEETGWGVVPAYASGRLFRDRLGYLLQEIGFISDTVYLVTAGHVLNLSILGQSLKDSKL
jgi:adenosylcobinamide kinase/adenosylcobinamide-phosphate guanylyltransferase